MAVGCFESLGRGLKDEPRHADGTPEGTAIKDSASPQLLLPRGPAPRHTEAPEGRRFSPLNAPQRALVASFVQEARPWAMRQAKRSYRHLPVEMHEQAYESASIALLDGAVDALDRRAMYGVLAGHLDDALRRLHVGWCLNSAKAGLLEDEVETADSVPSAPRTTPSETHVADFVDKGLGGLERAVLQLELGAGRDTSVVRAALRLGPRQYSRHREGGLAKLRAAITAQVGGRVCEQHMHQVVMAATGDQSARDALSTGADRCRSCAREATALRRLLNDRLLAAPWPLAIKPAGLLMAKAGAVGAVLKGKGAVAGISATKAGAPTGGAAFGGGKAVATVLAVAAATGGTAAVVGSAPDRVAATAAGSAANTLTAPVLPSLPAASSGSTAASTTTERAAARKKAASKKRDTSTAKTTGSAPSTTTTSTGDTRTSDSQEPATTTASKPVTDAVTGTVKKTVDGVKETVGKVRGTVKDTAKAVPTIDTGVLPTIDVGKTVDDVDGAVGGLLNP